MKPILKTRKARDLTQPESNKLLSAKELLVALFSKGSRPSERWLREMQVQRKIPYIKIGHLVRFDPAEVRAALVANWTVEPRSLRRR